MHVQVVLFGGYTQQLLYRVPDELCKEIFVGSCVRVPVRRSMREGIVIELVMHELVDIDFQVRSLISVIPIPLDMHFHHFIEKVSDYYALDCVALYHRFIKSVRTSVEKGRVYDNFVEVDELQKDVQLTVEQQQAVDVIVHAIDKHISIPTVLHGVTGSGKTEVYKCALLHAYHKGLSSLFLFPEVSLAVTFYKKLRSCWGETVAVYSFHSSTSVREKRELWQRLLRGEPTIILGVHLPMLLPMKNLGLLLLDEEHDHGYQEKNHPRLNTRDIAIMRAQHYSVPIVLGSATPSFNSLYNVVARKWHIVALKQRFVGEFPKVTIACLKEGTRRRNFWVSSMLDAEITKTLARREQIIIFINRRGFSFFVQCKSCNFVFLCLDCSVTLTYHEAIDGKNLICHYCSFSTALPGTCPSCSAREDQFLKKGIGTQQVAALLQTMYPHAKIGRADLDTTVQQKRWGKVIEDFAARRLDILVGTQTITKGYHFPHATLVGILWADIHMHMPFYHASETALQQLLQVAGRVGRSQVPGQVILQTMAQQDLFCHLDERTYPDFYEREIKYRQEMSYPPCARLALIEMRHACEELLEEEVAKAAALLINAVAAQHISVAILGPSKPLVHKVKRIHSRIMHLKSNDMMLCAQLYRQLLQQGYRSSLFFQPNPLN